MTNLEKNILKAYNEILFGYSEKSRYSRWIKTRKISDHMFLSLGYVRKGLKGLENKGILESRKERRPDRYWSLVTLAGYEKEESYFYDSNYLRKRKLKRLLNE